MTEKNKDSRVMPTVTLWIVALLMFIMSVMPLVQASERGDLIGLSDAGGVLIFVLAFLPLLVLSSAALGTYAIWRFGKPTEIAFAKDDIKQIQERVANLETIISYEENSLRTKIDRLRSGKD